MRASKGDKLTMHGRIVGQHDKTAEILEVLGDNGAPPYRVRFQEDKHEAIVTPGSDCTVEHKKPEA
ncbi:DUF1918 domain-containing protein [Streptomyces sannanensis]|uniref:DUF1918 domain-containing protein n=1 Tax=Streptomyces sannanensis TaxID=285536 RepID=A0ABP6S6L9_9ACTN